MQLPKVNPRKRRKKQLKYCQYQGCGREFLGIPIQKYCDFHRDSHNRKKPRRLLENVTERNQVFKHKFVYTTSVQFICALPGCNEPFELKVLPRQYVYPKYCEAHRSEFKRDHFARQRSSLSLSQ